MGAWVPSQCSMKSSGLRSARRWTGHTSLTPGDRAPRLRRRRHGGVAAHDEQVGDEFDRRGREVDGSTLSLTYGSRFTGWVSCASGGFTTYGVMADSSPVLAGIIGRHAERQPADGRAVSHSTGRRRLRLEPRGDALHLRRRQHGERDGCDAECRIEPCWDCFGDPSLCQPTAEGLACEDGNPCTTDELCTVASACERTATTRRLPACRPSQTRSICAVERRNEIAS